MKLKTTLILFVILIIGMGCNLITPNDTPVAMTFTPEKAATQTQPAATPTPTISPSKTPTLMPTATETPTETPVNPGDVQQFTGPDGFYYFYYPTTWKTREAGQQQQVCDPEFKACVAVKRMVKVLSAGYAAENGLVNLKASLSGFENNQKKDTYISGYPAVTYSIKFINQGSPNQGSLAYVVRHRLGFEVMAFAPENDYSKYKDILQTIVRSFRLVEFNELPIYNMWKSNKTEHLDMRYLPGTWAASQIENITGQHEEAYSALVSDLNLSEPVQVTIYLYPSSQALYRATGREFGHSNTDGQEIHALWVSESNHQTPGHELVHVLIENAIKVKTQERLLTEGLAVCFDQSGRDYQQIGADWLKQKKFLPFEKLQGNNWLQQDSDTAYTQSGIFTCYLAQEYGIEAVKQMLEYADLESALSNVLQKDIKTVTEDLYTWLE
jgi:hypothetical protein